jgi:putative transposase
VKDKTELSEIGMIVKDEWLRSPELRPCMNLSLDAFVVMPDHFHAILIIGKNSYNESHGRFTGMNKFGPQSKNLAEILRYCECQENKRSLSMAGSLL